MCVGGVEACGDLDGIDNVESIESSSLWNGREICIIERDIKFDFYLKAMEQIDELLHSEIQAHHYALLDLEEEICEEISENLDRYADFAYLAACTHPLNRDFSFVHPNQYSTDILQCKNIFKSAAKGVKKTAKKVGKEVKRSAGKVADFVKEHKKEILIGAAVVAVAVGGYLLIGALAANAAGVGALGTLEALGSSGRRREDEEDNPEPSDPKNPPPPKDNAKALGFHTEPSLQSPIASYFDSLGREFSPENNGSPSERIAALPHEFKLPENIPPLSDNTKSTSPPASPSIPPLQSSIANHFDSLKSNALRSESVFALPNEMNPNRSCRTQTEGLRLPGRQIGFINGMLTPFKDHQNHLQYIKKFAGDLSIEGVYNHSNSLPIDLGEIFIFNYHGVAPRTGDLLLENWTHFHEENKDNPNAKYLQIAHSMGTLQTRAALLRAPQEIRDRVIVIAVGPAITIPEDLCYSAVHYESDDFVHYGEDLVKYFQAANCCEDDRMGFLEELQKKQERLTSLEPHPEAPLWGHPFQNPTFKEILERNIESYLDQEGQYQ